jgi:putative peptidoglycan lipid II flippase
VRLLISARLARFSSDTKTIASGLVVVSTFVVLGKVVSATKEVAIAWRYGVSQTTDMYNLILNLVNWPVAIWFNVLNVVLIPTLALLRNSEPQELNRFNKELLGLTIMVALGFGISGPAGFALLRKYEWMGLSSTPPQGEASFAAALLIIAPLGVLASHYSSHLLAEGRHWNTLLEATPSLVILIFLIVPVGYLTQPLIVGTICGSILHVMLLFLVQGKRYQCVSPSFRFRSPAWGGFGTNFGIMLVGQVLLSLTALVDQFFAARIGEGAVSIMSYSNRVVALLLGLGSMSIARATFPVLASAHARGQTNVDGLAIRWAIIFFVSALVLTIAALAASGTLMEVIFERGALQAADTSQIASAFRYSIVQLPFFAFSITLSNYLASRRQYFHLMLSGLIGLLAKVLVTAELVAKLGLEGLVFSSALVYLATSLLLLILVKRGSK